jgi:hypothetical protein
MQTNLDFKDPLKTICWILSVLSWLLFLVSGWMGFSLLVNGKKVVLPLMLGEYTNYNIWSFLNILAKVLLIPEDIYKYFYFPIQEQKVFYIILFVILMVLGTVAFFIYLFKSVIKKDDHVFEGMMGTFSRYHFIPLVCASALFLAGYTQEKSISGFVIDRATFNKEQLDKYKGEFTVNLVFSLLGLLTLIFVKMQTKIENPLYVVYSIKDGLYSCLIALFTYCVFYSGFYIGLFTKYIDGENLEDINKYKKDCGIAFSICIGVINLCVSFVLKDFILPIINFIIYLGLAIKFFDMDEELRKQDYVTNAEGTIEIVVTVLSAVVFAFLIYLKIIRKH